MTHLFPLLTALLAASSAVAWPGAGYRAHGKRRCAAPSGSGSAAASGASGSVGASASAPVATDSAAASGASVVSASGAASASVAAAASGPASGSAAPAASSSGVPGGVLAIDEGTLNATVADNSTITSNTTGAGNTTDLGLGNSTLPGNSTAASGATAVKQGSSGRPVFAHFMVGIVSTYDQAAWEKDMKAAQSYGIDGFAVNIAKDAYTETQLDFAYAAAKATGFKLFISFDFNYFNSGDTDNVAALLKKYATRPENYLHEGKPFVSSFAGHDFDWGAAANAAGGEFYFVPNWMQDGAGNIQGAGQGSGMAPELSQAEGVKAMTTRGVQGMFSWNAWPNQMNNESPTEGPLGTANDELYANFVGNGTYMAPVSPWFFTHFGPETGYPKNWLKWGETLWVDRWNDILSLGDKVDFIEIITWNDYGESHYVGPLDSPHTDDGASKWVTGMPHTAMLDLAVPYINAFKNGASNVTVEKEGLVYWQRPHLKDILCPKDRLGAKPKGVNFLEDVVFVAALTKNGGTVKVTSGSKAAVSHEATAGVTVFKVPMGTGAQAFELTTSAGGSASGSSELKITDQCWNNQDYNYNFYSGAVWA